MALWDASSGKLLIERKAGAEEIYTLDWSPAGDVLVTAGLKGKIILWDGRKLSAVRELSAPEWVIRARFSPDGRRLFTAGGAQSSSGTRKVTVWGIEERQARHPPSVRTLADHDSGHPRRPGGALDHEAVFVNSTVERQWCTAWTAFRLNENKKRP